MPSRKKAKGKTRKAAKEAAKAKESQAAVEVEASADQRQVGSLETQLQRLGIKQCLHGSFLLNVEEKILQEFIYAFIAAGALTTSALLADTFDAAYQATKDEYSDVYDSEMDAVISTLLSKGTDFVLDGDSDAAHFHAVLACCFDEWTAVTVHESKAFMNWPKIVELYHADDHTLVQYFRKRIPCSCLDGTYKKVKSVKKMGCCYNPNCSQHARKVERSKMLCCSRCGIANYCSRECQKADWKSHKEGCGYIAEVKSAFDSKQQS